MSETVFHKAQIAPQVGTFAAPGATVAAITILPVTAPVLIELDRASAYPAEDYGRNIRNQAGRGYHGVRGASLPLEGEITFEQWMHILEMSFAGGIVPTSFQVATITSSSVANPTVITTAAAHGLVSGQTVTIAGHAGSTPAINGVHVVTVLTTTTFTIPVNVTVGGTGGTVSVWQWVYVLETGSPTLLPYTVEAGSETTQDQWEGQGVLVNELTFGFRDIDAPGAHPWTFQASCMALDRAIANVTGSLTSTAIETMQGHLSLFKEGTTATAFASLSEIATTLKSFSCTIRRSLTFRAYGGTSDVPTGYGFSEKTTGEIALKLKVGATTKTNIHDIYNSSGAVLGERRHRITVDGAGNNVAHFDYRIGEMRVDIEDVDGERTYGVTGEIVYDPTLTGAAGWTVINDIADLTP